MLDNFHPTVRHSTRSRLQSLTAHWSRDTVHAYESKEQGNEVMMAQFAFLSLFLEIFTENMREMGV